MVCIYCGGLSRVTNSRLQKRNNNIWRRRKCLICAAVFTTQEQPDLSAAFVVTNRRNPAELKPFRQEILFLSILQACGHRERSTEDAIELTKTIIAALPLSGNGTTTTINIAQKTFEVLSRFDMVAATYYKAYHLDR